MKSKLAAVAALLTVFTMVKAADGDDVERRWAFDVRLSPTFATASTSSINIDVDEQNRWCGPNFSAHVEYYLPATMFSIIGGYESEDVAFCGDNINTSLSQLMLGSHFYPCPRSWYFQPYVGLNTYWHVGGLKEANTVEVSGSTNYTCDYTLKRPRLSIAPVVGVDLYVFSSMALCVDYGYRFAINGRADALTTYQSHNATTTMHSRMHRHAISVGLKFTFPFSFTSEDAVGLIDSLFNLFDKNERKSLKRPLIYY